MRPLGELLRRFRPPQDPLKTTQTEGQTDSGFYNFFEDRDRFRKEAFWTIPGAVRRNGIHYIVDVDPLTAGLQQTEAIAEWYVDRLNDLGQQHNVNLLGVVQKQDGSTGAIQFAGLIAMKTNRPFVVVRLDKDIPEERIKIPLPKWLPSDVEIPETSKLRGRNVAIVTDNVTDGQDILAAVSEITNRGGKVTYLVTYVLSSGSFEENRRKLEAQDIRIVYAHKSEDIIAEAIKHNAVA